MTEEWREYWRGYRRGLVQSDADLLVQVGKTVDKAPVTGEVLQGMVQRIRELLRLSHSDQLLELCCGNGVITRELAPSVHRIVATDFSEHLIESARNHSAVENVEYRLADATTPVELPASGGLNKALMNDALGYFDQDTFGSVLAAVVNAAGEGELLFLCTGIPDASMKDRFYNTDERMQRHLRNEIEMPGVNDGLGRWWERREIDAVAKAAGADASFISQPEWMSSFRFDALIMVPRR